MKYRAAGVAVAIGILAVSRRAACMRSKPRSKGTLTRRSGRAGIGQDRGRVRVFRHSRTDCLLPQSGGEDTRDVVPAYVTNPASAPAIDTWYAEPAKVFDNLYFVGGKIHSAWALTTSEGIILIDTIFPYNSEELIIKGMQKVGLDPKNIRFMLISHAHGDHIGGAEMLQTRYGVRVVMGGPDWIWSQSFRTDTKRWRRKKTSLPMTA